MKLRKPIKVRRDAAEERAAARAGRTNIQQIEYLKARGHSHCKEVTRLENKGPAQ